MIRLYSNICYQQLTIVLLSQKVGSVHLDGAFSIGESDFFIVIKKNITKWKHEGKKTPSEASFTQANS